MSALHLSDFASGTVYEVSAGGSLHALTLDKVQALSDSGREGGSFRLEFLGPGEPVLQQGTYLFTGGGDEGHEIFIVPVAREAAHIRYEAVFY